ncbi:hypothetical protein LguiB_020193 [Lonicera macranthoides]
METNSTTTPCPNTVTVRRNPPRRARATPSSTAPLPMPSSTPIPREIPSFPIEDIISIQISQNPKPDPLTTQQQSSSLQQPLCENLKVFLRIRPLTTQQSSGTYTKNGGARSKNVWPQNPNTKNAPKTKVKKKSEICLKVNDSHSVILCPPQSLQDLKRIKSEVYEGFSHVFSADSSQEEVYKQIVNPLVEDFMKGKSGIRSQCIINIRSAPTNIEGEVDDQSHGAVLTIVDLAGAEREKKTGNQGARLLEIIVGAPKEPQETIAEALPKLLVVELQTLTKYLRDYLEGKKRMTLILTLKSGEEDYLDASFLLRQASPYMKIKFDSVEEPLNVITNKRHFQTLPRVEHLKRMKLSNFEACTANEGKGDEDSQLHKTGEYGINFMYFGAEFPPGKEVKHAKVLVQSATTIGSDLNDYASADENIAELAKGDRDNQIMQGFAKAFWKVLKQYKNKLEVAENEIQCLRDGLTSERARSFELENELKNLKSCHSCVKEVSEEKSTVDEVNESRADFAESGSGQSTCSHEHSDNYPGNVHNAEDVKEMKDLETEDTCVNGEPTDSGPFELSVSSSHLLVNPDNASSSVDGNLFQNKAEVRSSGVVTDLCLGAECAEEQSYKNGDGSPQSVHHAEDLQDIEDIGTADICSSAKAKGSGLSESVVSCSQSLVRLTDDSSLSVEGKRLQNEVDTKLLEDPLLPKKDETNAIACSINRAMEFDPELVSCSKPLNPEKPKRRLLPASSVLLRNISSLDFEDENENEKPKGNRREKKVDTDVTKRTQGSISLLRLLTDNLHL